MNNKQFILNIVAFVLLLIGINRIGKAFPNTSSFIYFIWPWILFFAIFMNYNKGKLNNLFQRKTNNKKQSKTKEVKLPKEIKFHTFFLF